MDFIISAGFPLFTLDATLDDPKGARNVHLIDEKGNKILLLWTDLDAIETFIEQNRDDLRSHGYPNVAPFEIPDEAAFRRLFEVAWSNGEHYVAFDLTQIYQKVRRQIAFRDCFERA